MKNKNVLVTGGAGFIGSNLVKYLVENDNNVKVLDNFSSGFRINLEPFKNITIIDGDIRNRTDVEHAIRDTDVIFHLAASVGNKRSIENPITDAEINVLGTIQILEAARKQGIKKIVTSSSASIYGEPKIIPIKEDTPPEPDSQYGCTKLCEEKLSLAYSKLYDMEVICLRYFNVYGINHRFDAYGSVFPIFLYHILQNEPISIYGDGEQTRDFVNVNDIVQANIKAAEANGVSGAFNVGSGKRTSINQVVKILSNIFDNIKINHMPKRLGDVKDSQADISLIKEKINYIPEIDLEKGLEEFVIWSIKQKYNNNTIN